MNGKASFMETVLRSRASYRAVPMREGRRSPPTRHSTNRVTAAVDIRRIWHLWNEDLGHRASGPAGSGTPTL